jgi:hypothetical protein
MVLRREVLELTERQTLWSWLIQETALNEKDQNALYESGSSFPPQPAGGTDIHDAGAAPAVAGANGTPTQSQTTAATTDLSKNALRAVRDVKVNDFLTFDTSRKYLARIVEIKNRHVNVRRFDKKSGTWLTKVEPRDRNSGIVLSPEEAEGSFPGCIAAWEESPGENVQTAQQSVAPTNPTSEVLQRSEMSPEHKQYLTAIGMRDDQLGKVIKEPTERINKRVGNAVAHETKAKEHRRIAQKDFNDNLAFYYEAKQRLLNPKYRPDLNTGKERTEDDNLRNFGAKDWQQFNAQCMAYSLQHANQKLKQFAKAEGLLTDDGGNIDDPEPTGEEHLPEPRRNEDLTAQKRYEHIATAAMSIANANPADEVSKQILAAAEHIPAPLMPILPDLFTDVLNFINKIASSISDAEVKAEAKRLVGKMLIHIPKPDPAKILDAAQQEEQRKHGKRLASKNGGALGSAAYNPLINGTAEPVQMDRASAECGRIEEPCAHTDPPAPEIVAAAQGSAKRFHWVERIVGGQTQLIILDRDKVYDCYPTDALQEVKARIDQLNADGGRNPN